MKLADVELAQEPKHISYSALNNHRQCPRKWYYQYVLKLTKSDDGKPQTGRELGSWWHALRAADTIERGRKAGTIKSVPEFLTTVDGGPTIPTDEDQAACLPELVMAAARKWYDDLTEEVRAEWESNVGQMLPERLTSLDSMWKLAHAEETRNEQPIAVELNWKRKLGSGEESPELVGYIDEVYYDVARGMCVIRDHKTAKALDTQSSNMGMMDSQLHLYAWGAAPTVAEWGYKVKALAYDRIRTKVPTTPKLNKGGTLSKSVTDYDLDTYLSWVAGPDGEGQPYEGTKKDGSGAGVYTKDEQIVSKLSTPEAQATWVQRKLTPINTNVIKAHLQAAADTYDAMLATHSRAVKSHDAARNLTAACQWCEFAKLCRAQMFGGNDGDYDLEDYALEKAKPRK